MCCISTGMDAAELTAGLQSYTSALEAASKRKGKDELPELDKCALPIRISMHFGLQVANDVAFRQ